MTKCSVGSARNRSAGSNSVAALDSDALPARKPLTSSAVSRPGFTRRTRKNDAEDERRKAKQTGADEKQSVRIDERPSRGEPLDPHAGEPLRELADVGVRRAQERVLCGRVAETRQARHVRYERDAREADAEVVRRDHRAKYAD